VSRAPSWWITTVCGVGLLPIAPGTWGSLVTLPFAWAIASAWSSYALIPAAALVFTVGAWAADDHVHRLGREDPGEAVIDEVAGQMITLALVPPGLLAYAIGFLLFRVLDIVKPFPANWCDRNVKGGIGVMSDDMVSGLYGMVLMALGGMLVQF
jgi:phosphatidylglycerophosphatase A